MASNENPLDFAPSFSAIFHDRPRDDLVAGPPLITRVTMTADSTHHTILVVDDESDVVDLVCYNLEKEGFKTLSALDGIAGLDLARRHRPSAIILDLMLPGMTGLEIFASLKHDSRTRDIPVIMVTAKAETTDRIAGLKAGVDDYVTKPFSPKELVLRLRAVLKWKTPTPEVRLESGPFFLDRGQLHCYIDDERIDLTTTEFKLLAFLLESEGRVVTRKALFQGVWGAEEAMSRKMDTHLMRLREKLGDHAAAIQNVRGKGYRFHLDPPQG